MCHAFPWNLPHSEINALQTHPKSQETAMKSISNTKFLWENCFHQMCCCTTRCVIHPPYNLLRWWRGDRVCAPGRPDNTLGSGPGFLQHSCRWGPRGGAGPPRERFLYEPVSLCWVFGGGTQLTVLGESLIRSSPLLPQQFGPFSAGFAIFLGVLSVCGHIFTQDPGLVGQ